MKSYTVKALTACSPAPGRLDILLGTDDGGVWHKTFDGAWSAWHTLGRPWSSPEPPAGFDWLTTTSSGPGRIEVFALVGGREMQHRRYADGGWTEWESRGVLAGSPVTDGCTAAATDIDDLHVLFHDGDGSDIVHWQSDGTASARPSGLRASGPLQAVSAGAGRFDLVVSDVLRHRFLRRRFSDGWSDDWDELGSAPEDGASSGCFAATGRDLFTVGRKGLWHRGESDRPGWEDLGGDLAEAGGGGTAARLAAVSSGDGRTDVFAVWAGVALMHRWFERTWSDWQLVDVWADTQGYHALRPEDLVALTVRGTGLRERMRADGVVEVVAASADARLTVEFPPQHTAETVLESGTSSQARLAGPSRLHFALGQEVVPLTVDGVLEAMGRLTPIGGPDTPEQGGSRLELPSRLLLALPPDTHCAHRALPAPSSQGTTELWHSRVDGPVEGEPLAARPYRALPDSSALPTPLGPHVGTIAALGVSNPGTPVKVDRLILSAYGAWFSSSASWSTLDWSHHAAMGRDYYVRVLQRGALFPFGHRASYVEMAERRFDRGSPAVAALRVKRVLIVTEPTRTYGIGAGGSHERAFPFQQVTIEPQQVTELDTPDWLPSKAFWPAQGGATVEFTAHARAGRDVVDLRLPLLFVDDAATGTSSASALDAAYARGPRSGVHRDLGRPASEVGRRIPLAMQSATQPLQGAVQEVHAMSFGGVGARPSSTGVGFHPQVTRMEVALPAVRQLLGSTAAMPAEFSKAFVGTSPGAQPPEVMLALLERKVLNFASTGARTGMLAAPNMTVSEISRTMGPTVAAPFPTDPKKLFDADAKLFGVVPLRDVVSVITTRPRITWSDVASAPSATLTWHESLSQVVEPFRPGTTSKVFLEVVSKVVDGRPDLRTTGEITDFALEIPSRSAALVILTFRKVRFTADSGARPSLTFDLEDARLAGKLNFVKTLMDLIPQTGDAGPRLDVSASRIKAAYAVAVPTVGMGVFTVQNLTLEIGLTLSLEGRPIVIDFAFGTRERPFLVTVSGFGGGGYLELGVSAGGTDGGLQRFVGGIEFGAGVAMDFVVASGEVHVFGGVVFVKQGGSLQITGYLRIGGSVSVLGLIRVSVELTISLTYDVDRNVLHGSAKLVITVDLTFWSTSVTLECHKSFKGPSLAFSPEEALAASSTELHASSVEDALGQQGESFPWHTYCRAFAAE
ncbi:hypothetical protein NPS70_27130 [Streptomyces sp. C10-9-1]|uniref:hypothetical protein n=1 Tax=Streptomyces sp. C10-9-1 TaxID=1859285 RepID=UPI0021135EFF|nr:hypothetical protein [Streptomyces sp. C10-9-1]MCQ6556833.1 hypothetical protein [Streptomyces sp. C10-9-1]